MAENKSVVCLVFFSLIQTEFLTDWWDLVGPYGVGWWKMKVWLKILYLNMFYVILLNDWHPERKNALPIYYNIYTPEKL